MIYLVIFILLFTGMQFITALVNFLFRANYNKYSPKDTNALVSVIIPARNEEKNIAHILDDLANQSYKNLEIIVADDDSSDNTAAIVLEKAVGDARINLIRAGLHDELWFGKNHACHEAAEKAEGKYLLFVDADVRLQNNAIAGLIGYFDRQKVSLLSVFPKQLMPDKSIYKVVPIMNYILLTLLPLILVRRSSFPSLSAANGQLMLFDTKTYHHYEPHKIFRRQKVEDIHIARFFKRQKEKMACITGLDNVSCKMYDSVDDAMQGFSKNVVTFFGDSTSVAIAFWLINFAAIIPVVLFGGWKLMLTYLSMIILIKIFTSLTSRQSVYLNLKYHYHQQYYLGKLIFLSEEYKKKKAYQWKGRNIS